MPRRRKTPRPWHREVGDSFIKDLPNLVGWWLAFCVVAALLAWATGYEKWPAALWFGFGLLPFGVPMIPVFWLGAGWSGFGLFAGLRQVWLLIAVTGWMFVTLLFAIAIATVLWGVGGVEHV
jgi:hypothetical protein